MDNSAILRAFVAAGAAPVSGDKLARSLGVSRVAVWARLERLRREGFVFDSAPRVGSRLVKTPDTLHGGLLDALLDAAGAAPPTLRAVATVDSTNNEVERLLNAGAAAPVAVLAARQTAGRGRLGRVWNGAVAGNLYLSVGVRPQLPPARMRAATLAVGLRLCERLAADFNAPLSIKWPNDLVAGGRKVAGILAEARLDADRMRDLVVGVGLNINSRPEDFPPELRDTAGSLAWAQTKSGGAGGAALDFNAVAAAAVTAVLGALADYARDGGLGADFAERWRRFDALAGAHVTARAPGGPIAAEGVTEGIDPDDGSLLVRDAAGALQRLHSGEVTLSKQRREPR